MLSSRILSRSLAATSMLLTAACGSGPTEPITPTALSDVATSGLPTAPVIADASRNGGDPRFYWLAPIVKNTTPAGKFDPDAQPEVSVCVVATATADASCVGEPVASFSRTTGSGSETVRVDAADELYIVNFHTDRFPLDPAKTYRINVQLDGRRVGFADLELGDNARELKNVNTLELVPLVDGRTLPIKFSVRKGVIVPPTAVADRFEGLFDRRTTITIPVADLLKNDFLGTPEASIAAIQTIDDLGGQFALRPDGTVSLTGATRVGTAVFSYTLQNAGTATSTATVIFRVGSSPLAVADTKAIVAGTTGSIDVIENDEQGDPNAVVAFSVPLLDTRDGAILILGSIVTLEAPKRAGTIVVPYTLTNELGTSPGVLTFTVQPAAPIITFTAGAGQTGAVGQALPIDPVVKVADEFGNLFPARSVSFIASADGSVANLTAVTDATGVATAGRWMLSTVPGTNQLTASTAGAPSVSITAIGTAPDNPVAPAPVCVEDGFQVVSAGQFRLVPGTGSSVGGAAASYEGFAEVRTRCGAPVPNAVVVFKLPPDAQSILSPGQLEATTDAAGNTPTVRFVGNTLCTQIRLFSVGLLVKNTGFDGSALIGGC